MKKYLLLAILTVPAFANQCETQSESEDISEQVEITTDVPSHLKGAVIIVRQADGKESVVPAEKFKVVPRKQQFITIKTKETKVISCVDKAPNKNRVSALGGHGTKSGLKSSTNGSVVEVENRVGGVFGLQYQRLLTDRISVGVQGQDNKTGSLVLGLDF